MTSQTGKKIITIQVLPSISRSKDNQAMKIGHLIKLRENNFSEKSCKKWDRETNPRPLFVFKNL